MKSDSSNLPFSKEEIWAQLPSPIPTSDPCPKEAVFLLQSDNFYKSCS